jgi:hypothetical protein
VSLPKKYDRRIQRLLQLRAVWEPGAAIDLGDIVTLRRGVFVPVDSLADLGISFRKKAGREAELSLSAQGVAETLLQADTEIPDVSDLIPSVKAKLEIVFKRANTYHLRTPKLKATSIDNLRAVGKKAAKSGDWNFQRNHIVWKVLTAEEFSFLGSLQKNRKIAFSGSGKAIAKLMTAGISAGLTRTSSRKLDLEIHGKGGPIVIGVTRIRRDGQLRDV